MSGLGTSIDLVLMATPVVALLGLWTLWRFLPRVDAFLRAPGRLWKVAIVAALLVIAVGSPVLMTSISFSRQRAALVARLAQADLRERNPVTVELLEKGSVTVGEIVYRSPQIRSAGEQLFDQQTGKVQFQDQLAEVLLAPSLPGWAPPAIYDTPTVILVISAGAALAAGAVLLGLATTMTAVVLGAFGAAALALLSGAATMLIALTGMLVLIAGYGVLSRLLLLALGGANPTTAVANIVLRESTRQWYTGAFILVLLVVLPLVPLAIDTDQPLRYRVQTFLGWSLGVSFGLAGLLTLVLSCATVALEIRDRQIWQTITKPVHRLGYIIGKWMGVVGVNMVLLAVSGVSMLLFVEYLRTQPAINFMDELAVRDEVLVARLGARPVYELPTREQLDSATSELISADPSLSADIQQKIKNEIDVRRSLGSQIQLEFLAAQRSVPQEHFRTYVFKGLDRARDLKATVTLSYLLHIGASNPHESHPVMFRFKDGTMIQRTYVAAQRQVQLIPWQYIDTDGSLTVEIGNLGFRDDQPYTGPGAMMWDADGIEVLFKVGSFEGNFLRAVLLEWIKLAFLAMLGICCATVLSFPVALLFTATVYFVGALTPFLTVAIDNYWVDPKEFWLIQGFQFVIRTIAVGANFMLSGFGDINGQTLLVEGRLVSWMEVGRSFLTLVVLWAGGVMFAGWAVFRRKEIAIYSGQGG